MSIPLVQNNEKDSINTSIIAIKRNIERINMLLGLVDSGSPDLSGLATKQELEDAITQVETDLAPVDEVTLDNMQSVTSNAVAEEINGRLSYHSTPQVIGKWIDGVKDVYKMLCTFTLNPSSSTGGTINTFGEYLQDKNIVKISGSIMCLLSNTQIFTFPICAGWDVSMTWGLNIFVNSINGVLSYQRGTDSKNYTNYVFIEFEYTL